jgi:hypothetical protein
MSGFFEALFKFFSEFTWRKLGALIIVGVCTVVALSLYERYTSSFRINRLQRVTELLLKVRELEDKHAEAGSDLELARTTLIKQVIEAVQQKPITLDVLPTTIRLSVDDAWHFLAGSALWFILAATQINSLKEKKGRDAFVGLFLVACVSGFFAIFTPIVWWPWFHLFIYPFLLVAAIAVAMAPFAYIVSKRAAKKKADQNTA